jgi:chromosome segregation ATPase
MATNRFACDPQLTGNLNAEYEALQNDLEQAKLLAVDYQNQLSDKSNAYAALKLALEKTTSDLQKLQLHIVALREERHRLANEVMKVVSLEAKLAAVTEELKRERANKREFIQVEMEEPASLIVIPTPTDPARAPKPFQPRG